MPYYAYMVVYPDFGIVKQKLEFRIYETTFFKEKNNAIPCLASARTTFNISTLMHDVSARYFGRNCTDLQTTHDILDIAGIQHVFQDRTMQ